MTEFYCMIILQCLIIGVSFYYGIKSLFLCVQAITWGARISNFLFAMFFFLAMLLIAAYWWDTLETNNTFFSKPIPNMIELRVK